VVKRSEARDFWVEFFIVFVGLYTFFLALDWEFLKLLVATASAGLLKLLGVAAVLSGSTVVVGPVSYVIVASCTGVVGFSLFAALVAASPLKMKGQYLFAAFPLFVAWNVVRVVATVLWSELHFWLWLATVAIVLVLFDWAAKREKVKL
jgi:exosortase/archaeosortase